MTASNSIIDGNSPDDRTVTNWSHRVVLGSIWCFNLGFLTLAGIWAWACRMVTDDYGYVIVGRRLGMVDYVLFYWRNWSGRWSAELIILLFGKLSIRDGHLLLFNIVTLLFATSGICVLLGQLLKSIGVRGRLWPVSVGAGIFHTGVVFFMTPSPGFVWYPLSGGTVHIWPIGVAGFAFAALVNASNGGWRIFASAFLFFVISGFAEGTAAATCVTLAAIAVVKLSRTKSKSFGFIERLPSRTILIPLAACIAGCVLSFSAPGNRVRKQAEANPPPLWYVLRTPVRTTWLIVRDRPIWVLAAAAAGAALAQRTPLEKYSTRISPLKPLAIIAVTYGSLCVVAAAPAAISFFEPPSRSLEPVFVLAATAAMVAGYHLWHAMKSRGNLPRSTLLTAAPVLIVAYIAWHTAYSEYPKVARYGVAFDRMYEDLHRFARSGREEPIIVEELPSSGGLPDANPTPDPDHWINAIMGEAIGLKCQVYRRR